MLVAPLPKRCETTLTSSGCWTKSAIFNARAKARLLETRSHRPKGRCFYRCRFAAYMHCFLFCFGSVAFQNLVHCRRRQVLVKVVVHLHRRRPATGPDTF